MNFYDVSLAQATNMIRVAGDTNTVLLQGHMGIGKSSILKTLAQLLPTHVPVYFDCTTKDLGDITIPKLDTKNEDGTDADYVRFVANEEMGLHLGKPIILMIDEFGKANPAVKNAMLRLMLEKQSAGYKAVKGSIIFATTNLGAEGVGDLLPAHARNRITVLRVRKPTAVEWIENYAIDAEIDPTLIAWVSENGQVFQSFEDDPKADNEYIYHPSAPGRVSFVTPRTLELASHWLKRRAHMGDMELTAALVGTVGPRAAGDLSAFIRIADQLPTLEEIKNNPMGAKVPTSETATCMVVHRTLGTIERNWTDAWMDYMMRLSKEAQGMFANAVRRSVDKKARDGVGNKRLIEVNTNKKYMDWCLANNYLFAAEKK
jgi:energy-coupling factor transporter ATP-binding protein EcfA2